MTAAKREQRTTEWVVLEWVERERKDAGDLPTLKAWRVVGSHVSRTRAEAYDALVGQQTGTFKAIPVASWRGGRLQAQETLITSKPLDD